MRIYCLHTPIHAINCTFLEIFLKIKQVKTKKHIPKEDKEKNERFWIELWTWRKKNKLINLLRSPKQAERGGASHPNMALRRLKQKDST